MVKKLFHPWLCFVQKQTDIYDILFLIIRQSISYLCASFDQFILYLQLFMFKLNSEQLLVYILFVQHIMRTQCGSSSTSSIPSWPHHCFAVNFVVLVNSLTDRVREGHQIFDVHLNFFVRLSQYDWTTSSYVFHFSYDCCGEGSCFTKVQ